MFYTVVSSAGHFNTGRLNIGRLNTGRLNIRLNVLHRKMKDYEAIPVMFNKLLLAFILSALRGNVHINVRIKSKNYEKCKSNLSSPEQYHYGMPYSSFRQTIDCTDIS
jgi:hypothetical protein